MQLLVILAMYIMLISAYIQPLSIHFGQAAYRSLMDQCSIHTVTLVCIPLYAVQASSTIHFSMHCCPWISAVCHASFPEGHAHVGGYYKGCVLFDAPILSGLALTGVHWPVHVFTDAVPLMHVSANFAGQRCHPLHNAVVLEPSDLPSVPAKVSSQSLTMLLEGLLKWPLCSWTLGKR